MATGDARDKGVQFTQPTYHYNPQRNTTLWGVPMSQFIPLKKEMHNPFLMGNCWHWCWSAHGFPMKPSQHQLTASLHTKLLPTQNMMQEVLHVEGAEVHQTLRSFFSCKQTSYQEAQTWAGSGCFRVGEYEIEGSGRSPCSGLLRWYCRPEKHWSLGKQTPLFRPIQIHLIPRHRIFCIALIPDVGMCFANDFYIYFSQWRCY